MLRVFRSIARRWELTTVFRIIDGVGVFGNFLDQWDIVVRRVREEELTTADDGGGRCRGRYSVVWLREAVVCELLLVIKFGFPGRGGIVVVFIRAVSRADNSLACFELWVDLNGGFVWDVRRFGEFMESASVAITRDRREVEGSRGIVYGAVGALRAAVFFEGAGVGCDRAGKEAV